MEEWRDVIGYEGYYKVSNKGNVYSIAMDRMVGWEQQVTDQYSRIKCSLTKDGETKQFNAARLVAEAFIPNPENKPYVDHIDTNTANNSVENLRWVTAKENSNNLLTLKHQSDAAKARRTFGRRIKARWKPVYQYSKEGDVVKRWESVAIAAETLGLHPSDITMTANNKRKTCGGYKWQWN